MTALLTDLDPPPQKSSDSQSKNSNGPSGTESNASVPASEPSTVVSEKHHQGPFKPNMEQVRSFQQAPPMVDTKVPPVAFGLDASTPQAQRLEDVLSSDSLKHRSSTSSNLECELLCHSAPN